MTDTIDKVIDVSSVCIKIGQFVFKDIAQALGNILGVGGIVKEILKLIPEDKVPDHVLEKLGVLEYKIDELANQMNAKFDDMKAFITEVNFYIEIVNPSSNLMKYMSDCLKHPTYEALENFKEAYARHPPLGLAYSVLSLLEHKSTNPLKMAMDADPLKTRTTFDKWEKIINGVLAEFLFLEAFGSGLLKRDSDYNAKRIIERANRVFEAIEDWRMEYKRTNSYWLALPRYMRKFMEENSEISNEKKADKMKEILETVLTYDAFYLAVFDKWTTEYLNYTFDIWNENQLIQLIDVGGSCAFIYKSKRANTVDIKLLEDIKRQVKSTRLDLKLFLQSPKNYPTKLHMELQTAEFICVIGFLDEEIRWANCSRNDGQPGWSDYIISDVDKKRKRTVRTLIAAYM